MASDKDGTSGAVASQPALPPVPTPPATGKDYRQVHAGFFSAMLSGVSTPKANGFHAARVDLASLKDAIEEGLKDFTLEAAAEQWDVDVRAWIEAVLHT